MMKAVLKASVDSYSFTQLSFSCWRIPFYSHFPSEQEEKEEKINPLGT